VPLEYIWTTRILTHLHSRRCITSRNHEILRKGLRHQMLDLHLFKTLEIIYCERILSLRSPNSVRTRYLSALTTPTLTTSRLGEPVKLALRSRLPWPCSGKPQKRQELGPLPHNLPDLHSRPFLTASSCKSPPDLPTYLQLHQTALLARSLFISSVGGWTGCPGGLRIPPHASICGFIEDVPYL
jgi:hypothetical protein